MDLTEPENRRDPDLSKTRWEGSGQPGPRIIRMFDGHRLTTRVPREDPEVEQEYFGNAYDCEEPY